MAKSVIINGVTYPDVPSVNIPAPSGSTPVTFYETSDATASDAQVLSGSSYYKSGGKSTGSMANVGTQSGTISTKGGTVTIQQGYHNGNGSVKIADAEVAKIIASNIRSGVTILGQAGSSSVVNTAISSDGATASDIISGKKAYVSGTLITGTATFPVISQDATTKVLSIS